MMKSIMIISLIISLITILLIFGAPLKPIHMFMRGLIKVVTGVFFLFFFNVIAASIGLHLPINLVTASIAGFLGIPGMISLSALHIFIFV